MREKWSSILRFLGVIFLVWLSYRLFINAPDYIDEVVMKGFIFGLPVMLVLQKYKAQESQLCLSAWHFWKGIFSGLALGAVYLFVGQLAFFSRTHGVAGSPVYLSDYFWFLFFVSLFTGWWESLLFWAYGWNVFRSLFAAKKKLATTYATVAAAGVFTLFHIPFILLQVGFSGAALGAILMTILFAVGQALVYSQTRNLYTLALSHALWGMMLLVYS